MRQALGIVLLLLVAGLALPVHSQDGSGSEPMRWPYFESESLIAPPDNGVRDFGHDVATDGERVLVAARDAAYLYARDQDHWVLEATLDAGLKDIRSVSLGDGHAVVATHGKVALWRHDLASDTWKQETTLSGNGLFGDDVLATEGFLLISQPRDNALLNAGSQGAVQVYRLSGGSYSHRQTLQEPTATNQRVFGADLALRGDTLVIGAPAQPLVEQAAPGAAYIYTRQGSTWSLTDTVEAGRGGDAESSFGHKVATTGTSVVVSASPSYLGSRGDAPDAGWVTFYEPDPDGDWFAIQEENTDATAIAAREDAVLIVDYWWSEVGVYLHESEQFQCWWGPWCEVGFLGGWDNFGNDNPFPGSLALEGRVAVLGAPLERHEDAPTGLVLAYYDNALPIALGLPDGPVQDLDMDGHEAFTLDASPSFDPDGQIVAYQWRQDGTALGDGPFVDLDLPLGTYAFELEVTDDLGGIGRTTLTVQVREPQLGLTIEYCCDWYRGINPGHTTYFWSDVEDHRAGAKHWDWDWDDDGKTDSTEATPRFQFPHGGTWPVHLTVTNEAGDTLHAYQDITVNNAPPNADAGPPLIVKVDAAGLGTATLDGSRSTDPDGTIRQYNWLQSDPLSATYSTAASGEKAEAQVTRGVNQFRLRVSDDDGATDEARITVIATDKGKNATGTPPTADFTIQVAGREALLKDASSPSNAPIVAWSWGPTPDKQTQGTRNQLVAFEDAGSHPMYLTVYDEDGLTSTILRTVEIPDRPPELSAWPLGGTVPQGTHGIFIASAKDEAPDRLQWEWRIDGSAYSDHQDAGHTFDELGNHTIDIIVTDDEGHTDALSGWIQVISEDEYRQQFGPENGTDDETAGLDLFEGELETPDDAIQEDLDRQRALDNGDDPDSSGADDKSTSSSPLIATTTPRPPTAGGVPVMPLVWTLIILLALALAAVETRRRLARRKRRRQRYEAAMKARLMRHEPAVEFRTGRR